MARPQKPRKVCFHPSCTDFVTQAESGEVITMALDEYETIRLIDFEGLSQDECARQMEVARTTVQAIYARARRKLAQYLVQGTRLKIAGGDVRLCQKRSHACHREKCCARARKDP